LSVARDRLAVLLAIRREAVDRALADLSACIAAEGAVAAALAALDQAARTERAAADRDGLSNEAFAAWSAMIRRQRQEGLAALARAEARTGLARTDLVATQAAMETVMQLAERRAALRKAEAERREGHVLDDIARSLRRARCESEAPDAPD
jgi:flagellar export protein FliJ